ncbi:LLM class flavin-dependent oxidoreductase [Streptomyces chartreusis]|uniref:LLM class flavin-dependent oxidoreductase n=1 Tax=Streptomyces chartreusis TaxID=1969 RepID=UPI0036273764
MRNAGDRPLRFGLHYLPQTADAEDSVAAWQRAESLGLEWCSVHDGMRSSEGPDAPSLHGLSLLPLLAARTTTVRCGILVVGVTYQSPAVLAKAAATIDHVSRGRLDLGFGAAGFALEHERLGLGFPETGTRLDMVDEALQVMRKLWTVPRADFEGRHFRLADAPMSPKPLQARLPVWIGGGGEKRTLRAVAQHADGWNYVLVEQDVYRRKVAALDRHCHRFGRDPREIRRQVLVDAVLGETVADALDRLPPVKGLEKNTDHWPRVPRLVGTPGELIDLLSPYLDLGVTDFVLIGQPPFDERTLELFAREVAPALRECRGEGRRG